MDTKILLIDNYDSFSYNLYQYIGQLCEKFSNPYDLKVIRNDEMSIEGIRKYAPSCIIISPGPGKPSDAGICEDVIKTFYRDLPILGVCLGHQAICEAFGGRIIHAPMLMHGKQSEVSLDTTSPIFNGLGSRTTVARYHSLAAEKSSLPECLRVIAQTDDGQVMAVSHKDYPVYGLQFHPESILTPRGMMILENFLEIRTNVIS